MKAAGRHCARAPRSNQRLISSAALSLGVPSPSSTAGHLRFIASRTPLISMRYPRMSPIMAQMGVHSSIPSSSIFGGVKEEQKEHNKAAASDEEDEEEEEEDAELDAAEDEAEATAVVERTTLALASVNGGRSRNLNWGDLIVIRRSNWPHRWDAALGAHPRAPGGILFEQGAARSARHGDPQSQHFHGSHPSGHFAQVRSP